MNRKPQTLQDIEALLRTGALEEAHQSLRDFVRREPDNPSGWYMLGNLYRRQQLWGEAIIGVAGAMKSAALPEEEKKKAVKDFNFGKGLFVAVLAGFMSACFNIGLSFGQNLFIEGTKPIFQILPATMLVTFGGFLSNACYCLYQNKKNQTWRDYSQKAFWGNNLVFCCLAGLLWYSQFFGLSLGKGFLTDYPVLITFSWCILMSLNVVFSNVWGIILKEWKGVSRKTVAVLVAGIIVLIISTFLPQLL